jgi:hypothetical protein
MLPSVLPSELTPHSPPIVPSDAPALVDCSGHCIAAPRYRRPRQCLRLPRTVPLLLRLAAQGAMPSRPSLLTTIMEVDETLRPVFLARSPAPSSRKRRISYGRTLSDLWSQIYLAAYQVRVKWWQAALAPDAMEHWQGM